MEERGMEDQLSFGQVLKQRRKALDLTQRALAARVGCTAIAIRKFEAGERRPSRQVAELLATTLQLEADAHAAFVRAAREGQLGDLPLAATADDLEEGPEPASAG